MCGIIAVLRTLQSETFLEGLGHLIARGPDDQRSMTWSGVQMGFARLGIQGDGPAAMQPFENERWIVMCNGEIFNHPDIGKTQSGSDCEVLLDGLAKWPIGELCARLDAEFALIAVDKELKKIHVARDPWGVRPLFIGQGGAGKVAFASEMKALMNISDHISQFPPGHVMSVDIDTLETEDRPYYILDNIYLTLNEAVRKRVQRGNTCCLLSGGLDSSLVAALAQRHMEDQLHTYSIGLEGSPDTYWAQKVADFIGSKHTTVTVTEREFLNAIPEVIRVIESYDITTVRASVGNYLIAKWIKQNTPWKVVLNGDFSDEVCGGYIYLKNAPSAGEFREECQRLLEEIHYFDCLRSDRTISGNGLEARTPFADQQFVRLYRSFNSKITSPHPVEKGLLRRAMDGRGLLPTEVINRPKEAFSDGVSKQSRSWKDIISDHLLSRGLSESRYYMDIYNSYYQDQKPIPHLWLPKWSGDNPDPSARTLKIYDDIIDGSGATGV